MVTDEPDIDEHLQQGEFMSLIRLVFLETHQIFMTFYYLFHYL